VAILSGILLLQTAIYYGVAHRSEQVPGSLPLSELPVRIGAWQRTQEGVVEKEVRDVLNADDLLSRQYGSPSSPAGANLFVAYFHSQRSGKAPHSPKNCLPGSGWTQLRSGTLAIPVAERPEPIVVNRYVVAKGSSKSMVFYWYHSARRVEASEYWAKIFLVLDAIRYNRSDTAMVRVVVPIVEDNQARAEATGVEFVRAVFPQINRHFPI
jgi:EpsI family protein